MLSWFSRRAHFTIEKNLRFFQWKYGRGNPLQPQTNLCRLVKFEIEFKSKGKMAIYHFSVKTISRGAGRSAVACSAYRSGEKLIDERQGKEQDYTRKQALNIQKFMPLKMLILSYSTAITFGTRLKKLNVEKMPTSQENLKLLFHMNLMLNNVKECLMSCAKNWSNDMA